MSPWRPWSLMTLPLRLGRQTPTLLRNTRPPMMATLEMVSYRKAAPLGRLVSGGMASITPGLAPRMNSVLTREDLA